MTHCLLGSLAAQSEFGDYDAEELGMGIQYLKESAPYAPNQSDEMLEKICELHKTHRYLSIIDKFVCLISLIHSSIYQSIFLFISSIVWGKVFQDRAWDCFV